MLSRTVKASLKTSLVWRRSFSAAGPSKDPVYQVFLDKVREYRLKSPTGKPVDPPPELQEELQEALEKLALKYGGGEGICMLDFPKFKLPDIDIDPISILDLPENKPKETKVEDLKKKAKSKSGVQDKKDEKEKKEEKGAKAKNEEKAKKEEKDIKK